LGNSVSNIYVQTMQKHTYQRRYKQTARNMDTDIPSPHHTTIKEILTLKTPKNQQDQPNHINDTHENTCLILGISKQGIFICQPIHCTCSTTSPNRSEPYSLWALLWQTITRLGLNRGDVMSLYMNQKKHVRGWNHVEQWECS
jgi:hypothetical protein